MHRSPMLNTTVEKNRDNSDWAILLPFILIAGTGTFHCECGDGFLDSEW